MNHDRLDGIQWASIEDVPLRFRDRQATTKYDVDGRRGRGD